MDNQFANLEIIKYLRNKQSPFYPIIEQLYEICGRILGEIPKTFSNYTLHDIGHSIRVIGYMNEFLKKNLGDFSDLHLAIIVFVGLLHDTGMAVPDDERDEIYREFETNKNRFIASSEDTKFLHFQEYVREKHGDRVALVMDRYINDGAKIKSLFYVGETKSYDLSNVVFEICQSHTKDVDWITKKFNKKMEYGNDEINPRHIAFLLRIADLLDIDDRRAPYFLYKFLNPQGDSDAEWKKQIPVTNYDKISFVEDDKYEITFSGECANPDIYRKVKEYIYSLDSELKKILLSCGEDKYKINIKHPVNVEIETIGFVDTQLRFNLEYKQIAKLLMGENIYGSKKDGLRELLQNAIDAVLLRENIESSNPRSAYVPTIGIEINTDKNQFIVFDNGVGMSETVLQNYFFNIGQSYYVSDEFNSGEYVYSPIGHFGIGFLACFMLSSKISLETRHFKDNHLIRMSFDKDSSYVTKFIDEEKTDKYIPDGTAIIMEYNQIVPSIFEDKESIKNYVLDLLVENKYKFFLIDDGKKDEIVLESLEKHYSIKNESIMFDYSIRPYVNIKFNVFNFFDDNDKVYVLENDSDYMEFSYVNLAYFSEGIDELERSVQLAGGMIEDPLDGFWDDYSYFLYAFDRNLFFDLASYYRKNQEIRGFFNAYLCSFIEDEMFTWYDVPIILSEKVSYQFLNTLDKEELESFLRLYKDDVQYISIVCKGGPPKEEALLQIIEDFLSLHYERCCFDYLTHRMPLVKKNVRLLKSQLKNDYLNIRRDYRDFKSKIYLKGILVKDEIMLPYIIDGVVINDIHLNIKSGDYTIDVSRNKFDLSSKRRLASRLACAIYKDLINQDVFDFNESHMVNLFLDKYYTDGHYLE